MSLRLVLFCWICMGVFVSGCGTGSQADKKDYPKAQVTWTWYTTFWLARGGGDHSIARREQQRPTL